MMKILLLGGTGAMGRALAPLLVNRGDKVCITSRSKHSNAATKSAQYIRGNAKDIEFLKTLFTQSSGQPFDVVVDFMVYHTGELKNRIDFLLSSCGQYVFLSSSRVYAESHERLTENSPRLLDVCKDSDYLNLDEYALAKAREEDIIRHSGRTNWTIVRPYITYNDNRLQLGAYEKEDWLYRALQGGGGVKP